VAAIALTGLRKTFPNGHVAIRHLDLGIDDGEFLVLVGPSGCGKSTLLRLIAGLEAPTSGRIAIGDVDVTAHSPQRRDLAMVFQSYALYPHMSVRDNLGYGLKARGTNRALAAQRIADVAAALDIEALLDRRPAQLSGGERQRVALGRALLMKPRLLLLDEPLASLDTARKQEILPYLERLRDDTGLPMIYVSHDPAEVRRLASRVVLLDGGRVMATGGVDVLP
jgi:ABC-type sugar transport system ATPase subunit